MQELILLRKDLIKKFYDINGLDTLSIDSAPIHSEVDGFELISNSDAYKNLSPFTPLWNSLLKYATYNEVKESIKNIIKDVLNEMYNSNDLEIKMSDSNFSHLGYNGKRLDLRKDKKYIGKADITFYDNIFSNFEKYADEIDEKIEDEKSAYIIGISILEKHRGNGYGEFVIDKIEEYAKKNGAKYVVLGSITSALGFWKKLGYKVHSTGNYFNMYKKI